MTKSIRSHNNKPIILKPFYGLHTIDVCSNQMFFFEWFGLQGLTTSTTKIK